jgi:hypothetical protein
MCEIAATAGLALIAVAAPAWQTSPHRSTSDAAVKRLKANDVELAYVEEGKRDAIVFVFDGCCWSDLSHWEPVRPYIAENVHYVLLSPVTSGPFCICCAIEHYRRRGAGGPPKAGAGRSNRPGRATNQARVCNEFATGQRKASLSVRCSPEHH